MKNTSCSQGKSNFGTFWVILLSFLALSLLVQSCRLNQNVLAQAVSMNQRGQGETNRLNLPDREGADIPSFNRSIPQSTIQNLSSTSYGEPQLDKAEFVQKTKKLQIPFIANNGQVDKQVKYYANTFGGTVFVTKDGEIVYALPYVETQCLASSMYSPNGISPLKRGDQGVCNTTPISNDKNETHPRPLLLEGRTGIALREQFVGAKVKTIQGEDPSVTKVNYFKGKDPEKWKTDISTFEAVSLGEVYDGIELKLKAYGNNVEKLFCVKPGANPERIKISLSGVKDCGVQHAECGKNTPLSPLSRGDKSEFQNLFPTPVGDPKLSANTHSASDVGWVKRSAPNKRLLSVNERGELEVETAFGPVKFTKPVAYQEIDGKRVEIECGYVIADCGMQVEAGSKKVEARSRKYALLNQKWNTKRHGTTDFTDCTDRVGWVKRSAPNKMGEGKDGFASLNPSYTNCIQEPEAKSKKLEAGSKRLIGSREKGMGRRDAYLASNFRSPASYHQSATLNLKSNHPQSQIYNPKLEYGFKVASYDKTKDLIIDPLLASTYLGASGNSTGGDYGNSIVVNPDGDIYVTGYTSSSNFPTTTGSYNTSYSNSTDIFISKLSGDLTSLLASTYLGGSGYEYGNSLSIDSSGNVYVSGYTKSSDFPTTTSAYDTSYNDSGDVFVSKLSGDLTTLLASTYLGGSDSDYANSTAIDSSGNVYVAGYTESSDFPTTTGAYDTKCCDYFSYLWEGGNTEDVFGDAFISKLNDNLTNLLASTFIGGSVDDYGKTITIDSDGNVYIAGETDSSDFPTTSDAYATSSGYYYLSCGDSYGCDLIFQNIDIFISKLNGELTKLLSSTCLGIADSYSNNIVDYIVIDASGNLYVTGYTDSSDFPTTAGAYDTSYNDSGDTFISRLNSDLTSLLASTFFGGSNSDYGNSIAIDSEGNVYVTGYTYSSDFPITTGACDTAYNDSEDVFVSELNGDLTSLLASTYLGGANSDYASSISIDASGNVYVVGYTYSSDFPTTTDAYDTSHNGNYDVFVSKLDGNLTSLISSTYFGGTDFYYDDYGHSITIDSSGSIYISGYSNSSYFPMDTETYDTSYNGSKDIFVSKFSGDLTSLLASTYLGGANSDYGHSISIVPSGIVYVTGYTNASDFPTTIDAYDTSYNGNDDVFVSKLSGDLTSLLASTYLGGSDYDYANSISIDASGNVCVAGCTYSSDFPTTTGAYGILYNDSGDVFLSKLSGDLTTILASTYLGGSDFDNAKSIAIDSNGNVYVTGYTYSSGFPTTIDAYDTSYNGNYDAFVSKLNGDLTNLLASTFLGGYEYDYGYSISTDLIGNVYVSGDTFSPNFPITRFALHAYYGDSTHAYISKFDSNLTSLLSSTYSKSGVNDCVITDSALNVYVAGSNSILKINDNLTRLLASASLDGDIGSLALDSTGNIYVAGSTDSTEFQTTTGAYDTYNAGDYDAFVSKFDSNLSSTSPTVTTGAAMDIKSTSATLNGSVNANGASTDVWFEYDTTSGSYTNTTSKQSLSGLNGTDTVSTNISGLSLGTMYYYRLAAQNDFGTTYGSETSFTTNTPSPPTVITGSTANVTSNSAYLFGNVNANEFLTTVWFEYGRDSGSYSNTSSTASVSGSDNLEVRIDISGLSPETTYYYRIAAQNSVGTAYGNEMSFTTLSLSKGSISGYVSDTTGKPIESVKVTLDGKKTFISITTFSDSDGFFAFYDLDADTYVIKASKKGYKKFKKKITLEAEEEKEIKIKMKKTRMRALE